MVAGGRICGSQIMESCMDIISALIIGLLIIKLAAFSSSLIHFRGFLMVA